MTRVVTMLLGVGSSGAISLADRASVQFTMDQMVQAVLAGDGDAYLLNVDQGDAVFLKEQQNWARDLALHRPARFELRIHEPAAAPSGAETPETGAKAPVFDESLGEARFELAMSWTMAGLGHDGADVSSDVSFPVLFRRSQIDGRWLYAGEAWTIVESLARPLGADGSEAAGPPVSTAPNIAMHFDGFDDVARTIVDLLPEVRAHVDSEFGNRIDHRQVVKIYPTMRHLQASIYLSYVDGLSGWNEPGESIKLLASNKSSSPQLRSLLAHEYGHVATFAFGARASDMPWWVLEGVAEQSAEKFVAMAGGYDDQPDQFGRDARRAVERWARRGRLAPWDRISVFRDTPREYGGHVYKQGQHMLGYLTRRFGLDQRNAWIRMLAQGHTLAESTQQIFGLSFEVLNADWRAALPPVEAEPASGDSPGPTASPDAASPSP